MIYLDKGAYYDVEDFPVSRGFEKCLNCNYTIDFHSGWNCNAFSGEQRFHHIKPNQRYLTQSMQNSLGTQINTSSTIDIKKVQMDLDFSNKTEKHSEQDWRAWAHNVPGDCPCAIKRIECQFHKKL